MEKKRLMIDEKNPTGGTPGAHPASGPLGDGRVSALFPLAREFTDRFLLEGPFSGSINRAPAEAGGNAAKISSNGLRLSSKRWRVLVVDDESSVAMVLKSMLSRMGHTPTSCNDPNEALEIFGDGKNFDAVISDQTMPGMHGLDMIGKMKERAPDKIYILMSGYASGHIDEGAIAQLDAFMTKPISLDVLRKTIESACARRGTEGTSSPSP